MIIETIVWIIYCIFIVWLSAVKQKHFMRERSFKKATKDLYDMKNKPSLSKTLDDKMSYLRQKTDAGQDVMTMIISTIIFIIGFSVTIYSRVTNFYAGLVAALVFALVFAFIFAKIQFTKYILEYKFIDAFIGYLFASTLMIYVKFIHNMHIILLLILSIAVMIAINKTMDKWVGNENIKR